MRADTVTLSFGERPSSRTHVRAVLSRREYENIKREVSSGYRTSNPVDRHGIVTWVKYLGYLSRHNHHTNTREYRNFEIPGNLRSIWDGPRNHVDKQVFHSTMRLAAKLGIPYDASKRRFKKFALVLGKFAERALSRADLREVRRRGSRRGCAEYDIGDIPISSTTSSNATSRGCHGPDKVKRFLRRHLRRVPTDKDIDTFGYMYFGSDAFRRHAYLFYGIENNNYLRNGQRAFDTRWPNHRPIGFIYTAEDVSNSNSNSNNGNTSAQYTRNKSRVNANKAKNKSYKNSIKWEEQAVNNLPSDPITLNTFSNGQKAVKIHPTANHYVSPQTFRSMARTSMTDAFNKNGNAILFKSPMTREKVRRSNIKFVILKNKNTGRATKAKKNAANKIGDARRRQLTRRSTLARAKAAAAALKRKRSQ